MVSKKLGAYWTAPIFVVLAIFAIYLALNYLPPEVFGSSWQDVSALLWSYLPYLAVFAVAMIVLWRLAR